MLLNTNLGSRQVVIMLTAGMSLQYFRNFTLIGYSECLKTEFSDSHLLGDVPIKNSYKLL
jgi:hypothetical protein